MQHEQSFYIQLGPDNVLRTCGADEQGGAKEGHYGLHGCRQGACIFSTPECGYRQRYLDKGLEVLGLILNSL